jgi:hypothetical protein
VSDQNRFVLLRRAVGPCFVAAVVAAIACAAPAAVSATTVTPESFTNCGGTVSHDRQGAASDEPNLLDYKFRCNGNISAFTIIVDQQGDAGGSIDDYNPAPSVFESDGVTPSPTETLACEGTTPSDGINCNAGGSALTAGFFAAGSIDPLQAYCKHLPAKAKGGTPAVPQAQVLLVVSDATGAEDGPFTLRSTKACPKVPNFVPARKAEHKQGKRKRTDTRDRAIRKESR